MRPGHVVGVMILALTLVGGAIGARMLMAEGSAGDQADWQALCSRVVSQEVELGRLRATVEELEGLIMLGSAHVESRLSRLEAGTRPVINVQRASIWNTDGEIVMEGRQ